MKEMKNTHTHARTHARWHQEINPLTSGLRQWYEAATYVHELWLRQAVRLFIYLFIYVFISLFIY